MANQLGPAPMDWPLVLPLIPVERDLIAALPAIESRHAQWLDRAGIWLSAMCAVHCVTSALLLTALASVGGMFLSPIVHEVGLMLAILLGAVALGLGMIRHGYMMPLAIGSFGLGMMAGALSLDHGTTEMVATLAGVLTLALGHDLNARAHAG